MHKELQVLESLLEVVDTKSVSDELFSAFEKMVESLDQMKTESQKERSLFQEEVTGLIKKLREGIASIRNGEPGADGENYILTEKDKNQIASKIPVPIVEKVVETIIKEQPIVTEITKEIPNKDSAEDIRNKLELLSGEERLDVKYIKGIEQYEKRLKSVENRPSTGGWSSASGGKIMKYFDLSPSLNGVLTTFSLPAFWRVINVQLSSAPNPLRENVDFTINASTYQITFTSQVNAATALSTGQSCLILYAE